MDMLWWQVRSCEPETTILHRPNTHNWHNNYFQAQIMKYIFKFDQILIQYSNFLPFQFIL